MNIYCLISMNKTTLKTLRRVLKFMGGLNSTLEGYKITRLEHSLQTATRAYKDNAEEEMVVAALIT